MNLNLPFSWVGTKEKHVLTLKQLQLRATPFHHPIKGYQVIKQLQSIERKHRKNRSAINLSMDMITKHHPTFFGLLPSTSRMSRYLIYIYPKIPDTIRAPDQDQWCQRCKELPEGNGHLSIPDSVKTGEVKRLRVCGCQCFKSNPWIHES